VLTFNLTISGGLYAVITVIATIMTITESYLCSANSYCDNNGEFICSVRSYCDNSGEVYMLDIPVIVTITVNTTNKPPRCCHNNC
jgi:hypothetical protein